MQSAYQTLGVAPDAGPQDIEAAFAQAERRFTRERLATEQGAADRLAELRDAYKILRDQQLRAAHDRKLASADAAARLPVLAMEPAGSSFGRRLVFLALWVGALSVTWAGYSHYREEEVRKAQAAAELAARKVAERQKQEAEEQERRRLAEAAREEAQERQLRAEGRASAARAAYESSRVEAAAANAQRNEIAVRQQQDAARRYEEQSAAREARARAETDKARVREMCYQNYRRPDC